MNASPTIPASNNKPSQLHAKLPGLNTLRFYAAVAVIFEHVSIQFSKEPDFLKVLGYFFISAQNAVNLFFVLSGFLITHLLLNERRTSGHINVRNFYIRRALRILPLYYWIVILGFVIFPLLFGRNYPLTGLPVSKLILALALLPNFAGIPTPMIHLWSIGVEEQFYFSWPWATKTDQNILRVCFGIIILKLMLTPVIAHYFEPKVLTMFYGLRFECMAIGALGAYVYARKYEYTKWLYNGWTQLLAISAFLYLMISNVPINTINTFWTSAVYIVLIMNVATNSKSLVKLNLAPLEKLGEISYGLYLYHFPVLFLIFSLLYRARVTGIWTSPALLLIVALLSTAIIAALSYRWYESPFLGLKKYFTVQPSKQLETDNLISEGESNTTSGILEKPMLERHSFLNYHK